MIHILIAHSSLGNGGITNVLKEIVRCIDNNLFHIDILMYEGEEDTNKEYFESYGCHVYEVINPKINYEKAKEEIKKLNDLNHYDVIHSCNYLNSGYLMQIGKELNIPIRIVHAHASQDFHTNIKYRLYKWLMQRKINKNATALVACSDKAGEFLFNKQPYQIIENTINADKYSFSKEKRNKIREKYGFKEEDIVLGMVGMLSVIKNHSYVLDILKELPTQYKLLIVGDGTQRETIEKKINEYGLEGRVFITGWVQDPYVYYSAFDIYLMPSLSEGFPLASLEAQANGLPSIFSNHVTELIQLSDMVYFLPIEQENIQDWVNSIQLMDLNKERKNYVKDSNYDSLTTIKKWERLYQTR